MIETCFYQILRVKVPNLTTPSKNIVTLDYSNTSNSNFLRFNYASLPLLPKNVIRSRLKEACMKTMSEKCSAFLLNELPSKEKDPRIFTTACQVYEKPKEAEDLAEDHLSSGNSATQQWNTFALTVEKCTSSGIIITRSGKALEHFIPNIFNGHTGGHHSANVDAKKTRKHVFKKGNASITFRAIKRIQERSVGYNPKEIKHKAHWALKQSNMDLKLASESRLMQLNELAELRDGAYEDTRIYKERAKKWHDSRLRGDKNFKVGDKVLLYNSRLKMYPGKLKSKWSGPNIVKTVGNIDKEDDEVLEFEDGVTKKSPDSEINTPYLKTLKNSRPLPDFEEYVPIRHIGQYSISEEPILRIGQYSVSEEPILCIGQYSVSEEPILRIDQ
nr:hypothetical protein [Tanacetum cinerariifolium]